MKNSSAYYNKIANNYTVETNKRLLYLNAIDTYIINSVSKTNIKNYLDIGSGDGRRSIKIAKQINVKDNIVLVDNSNKMLEKSKQNENVSIFNSSIHDFSYPKKFNLITCLWNVLGHFPDKKSLKTLFVKVESLLDDNGIFIFDVNNRYNISYYGQRNVSKNLELEFLNDEKVGWFVLGKVPNQTQVYIHSPFDIHYYLTDTNLNLEDVKYIDYKTGEEKNTFFEGQLLYRLIKK